MSFNVGDLVVVHRPSSIKEPPSWVSGMDIYDGCEAEIASIKERPRVTIVTLDFGDGRGVSPYNFNAKWLTLCNENQTSLEDDDLIHFLEEFLKEV